MRAKILAVFLAMFAALPRVHALKVADVTARQRWPWNNLVDIDFTVVTNGTESVSEFGVAVTGTYANGMKTVTAATFASDFFAVAGTNRVTWNLGADYPGFRAADLAISVTVSTEIAETPAYLVVDLSGGAAATSYPVRYTAQPPDVSNDTCRTSELWLRRMPAGSFTMGSPADELGRDSTENQAAVTLTKGFYIGIFEITQQQWYNVMGNWPSRYTNILHRNTRPVEQISYNALRGSSAQGGGGWPTNSDVYALSFIGVLRDRTGMETLDLPTAAQWEYACRAGTATPLYSGASITNTASDANVALLARYKYSGALANETLMDRNVTEINATAKVGTYLPNAWGLYDTYGNAMEWCLDWYEPTVTGGTDPRGPNSSSRGQRARRGGSYDSRASSCRSAFRWYQSPDNSGPTYGVRIVITRP